MGFEDEVEQSLRRPCQQTDTGRSKRTYDLTSSIVPRGTSSHRLVEFGFSSLIGHSGSSTFRLSTTAVLISLTGSRFSSESAPRPFQHGVRERSGTIFWAALPAD